MFNNSKELVKNLNSCNVKLKSALVIINKYDSTQVKCVQNPICIVDLLSMEELRRYKNIGGMSNSFEASVENIITRDKVKEVLGFKDYIVDLDKSPAGSITTIAYAIYLKSKLHLTESEYHYRLQEADISVIEQMSSIISYYMNIPYDKVTELPVNEIFKKYAIITKSFPSQVTDPFAEEEL